MWYDASGNVDEDWFDMSQALQGKAPPPKELPIIMPERLVEHNGQYWIHDAALWAYDNPGVGTIIRIKGRTGDLYFELDGRAAEAGRPVTEKGWWVHRIDPEGAFSDATPEDFLTSA